jgi:hypothetical protein
MKVSVSYDDCFEVRCAKEGGLALVKTLIIETENIAQKMNLQRNARKGMLGGYEVSAPGETNRVKEGPEKEWIAMRCVCLKTSVRSRSGVAGIQAIGRRQVVFASLRRG